MNETSPQKLWGSRFEGGLSPEALRYTETTDIDRRMVLQDLWGSIAHCLMLERCRIVTHEDARKILGTLVELFDEAGAGNLVLDAALEDVHLNVETRVIERVGREVGGKMHTARSRNDQVVTDTRLYLRERILDLSEEIVRLVEALLRRAREGVETVILGYTHSQVAQPITLGFWLSAHAAQILRDADRLRKAYGTVNVSPLGACALAGTSFPVDRELTSRYLGFAQPMANALDATSTRDFVLELAAALAILGVSFSRLAEELVLWSGSDVGLLDLGDGMCTGSSVMPQKRNPVVAELARARSSVAIGALVELLTVTKSVSLGYSCDLQQDKPAIWRSIDTTLETLDLLRRQAIAMVVRPDYVLRGYWSGFGGATELANEITRAHGTAFRVAYSVVGELVRRLEDTGRDLRDAEASNEYLTRRGFGLTPEAIAACVDPVAVAARQTSAGGTAPERVLESLIEFERELAQHADWAREERSRTTSCLYECLREARATDETREGAFR